MNNNGMNFDPITGQPIQNNTNNTNQQNAQINNQMQTVQPVAPVAPIEPQLNTTNPQMQQTPIDPQIENFNNLQAIPTVEQSKQEFINNTQSLSTEKTTEKKQGVNWTFIIILFAVILVAIIFLFPYLLKNL